LPPPLALMEKSGYFDRQLMAVICGGPRNESRKKPVKDGGYSVEKLYERISPLRLFHAVIREYMKALPHDQRIFGICEHLSRYSHFQAVPLDKMSQALENTRRQKGMPHCGYIYKKSSHANLRILKQDRICAALRVFFAVPSIWREIARLLIGPDRTVRTRGISNG
jgi:hypothetical protein